MYAIIRSECYRLFKRKIIYVLLLFTICMTVLLSLGFAAANGSESMLGKSMLAAINYQSVDGPVLQNADRLTLPHAVLSNLDLMLVFIVLPVLTAIIIGDDRAAGSLRMVLTRPFKGGSIMLGKLITLMLSNLLIIACTFFVSQICSMLLMPKIGSTTLVPDQTVISAAQSWGFNGLFYLLYAIKFAAVSCVFAVVSVLIKNTAVAVVADVALLIAAMYLSPFLLDFLFSALTMIYDIIAGRESIMALIAMLLLSLAASFLLTSYWTRMNYQE